jgi:cytochrome c peroxidase
MVRMRWSLVPVLIACCFAATPGNGPTPYPFSRSIGFPEMPVSATNPVTVEGARLGRYLFYDPSLSADGRLACAGCHRQEHAFSDSPERFSTGVNGARMVRNTMPLFNLAWYPAMFWDGRAVSIEAQITSPVQAHDEMDMQWPEACARIRRKPIYGKLFTEAFGDDGVDSARITMALAQFLRTLISDRSKYDRVLAGEEYFTAQEYAGYVLMNDQTKGACLHCHTTDSDALGTTRRFSNNGLDAVSDPAAYADPGRGAATGMAKDNGLFMVPSLRNVALTAPYMHDGRFQTLEQVLDFYGEGVRSCANLDPKMEFTRAGGTSLTAEEKRSIIAFLHTLSDSAFVTDPQFSDPFAAEGMRTGQRNDRNMRP